MKDRKERKKLPAEERQQPVTIEDKQEGGEEFEQDYEEEALMDEFNNILEQDGPVKILMTTQLKPPRKIYDLLRELMMVFHNVAFYPRRNMKL